MTAQNRSTNKALFQDGDKPTGSNYTDFIDSYVSLLDTTAQSVSSPLAISGALGVTTEVSANSIAVSAASVTGHVSAATVYANLAVLQRVSASAVYAESVVVQRVSASVMYANSAVVQGVSASAVYTDRLYYSPAYADIYSVGTAATTVAAGGTFVKLVNPTTAGIATSKFTGSDNRLLYTGPVTKTMAVDAQVAVSVPFTGHKLAVAIAKNGTISTASIMPQQLATSTVTNLVSMSLVSMVSGDYVEAYATIYGSAAVMTVDALRLSAYEV